MIGIVVLVAVGVGIASFVFFIDSVVVAVHRVIIEYKGSLACLCGQKGRNISSNGANACARLLFMLLLFCVRQQEVVPSSMT